jgi:exonuclease III
MATIKIATLNINGMTSPTRIAMLDALLRRQEIYILLVHEVTYHVLSDF